MRVEFVVFAESSVPSQPGQGSLDDPAFGQHLEALGQGSLDDAEADPERFLRPIKQLALVASVGVNGAHGGLARSQKRQQ